MKCDGSCGEHVGAIRKVRVWYGCFDWGYFNYCQAAVEEDERRGLIVNEQQAKEER